MTDDTTAPRQGGKAVGVIAVAIIVPARFSFQMLAYFCGFVDFVITGVGESAYLLGEGGGAEKGE